MHKSIAKVVKLGMAMGLVATALNLPAQAEAPKISGFIDTTYSYNFQKPTSRISANRSFDRKTDAFLLNSAQVNIQGDKEGVGYYAELAYGTDGAVYGSTGLGSDGTPGTATIGAPTAVTQNFELQEAFLTYKCNMTNLMFKAGKFATTQGIEVIESKDNFTISRGYLFGLGEAFTHTGAIVGYGFGVADIWVGAVNGWDTYTDNNTGKTLLAKIGITPNDMIAGSVSLLHGAEQANRTFATRTNIDTTWFIKPSSMFTVALQALAGQEKNASLRVGDLNADGINDGHAYWYGATIQPNVMLGEKFFVGGRYEWFSDLEGARANVAAGQILQNITIAPGVNLTESLMARVEYRYDWSSRTGAFENDLGTLNQSNQSTVGVEFIYKFGS